jgi:hypothetical protein
MNRRRFSRHLPALQKRPGSLNVGGSAILSCFIAAVIWLACQHPIPFFGFVVFYAVIGWIAAGIDFRRKSALAASRPGDPLCAFARSFDLRAVDPWIVRAAFEELQKLCAEPLRPFPILPSDRLVEDFNIHPDDIEDIAQDVAERAGYSLDHYEQNPLCGQVSTVGDLVQFLAHQPSIRNA